MSTKALKNIFFLCAHRPGDTTKKAEISSARGESCRRRNFGKMVEEGMAAGIFGVTLLVDFTRVLFNVDYIHISIQHF